MAYIPEEDVGGETDSVQEEYNTTVETPSVNKKNMNDKKDKSLVGNTSGTSSNRLIIVAILAFLIGFGVGFLVFSGQTDSTVIVDDTTDTENSLGIVEDNTPVEPVVVSDVSITVEDQNFGEVVDVKSASLDRTSWIVVFEDNNGEPGSILGAQLYDAGNLENAFVNLLRGTTGDSLYYVKIHSDDGDRQFDFMKDIPYLDESGNEITETFRTFSGTPR